MMPRHIPPITKLLLIVNIALFLITLIIRSSGIDLTVVLGAFFPGSPNFHLYQIITHMFMHGGWEHIIFNMITLFFFGVAVEMTLGTRKFAILYFVCGLGAFALFNAVNYIQVDQLIQALVPQGTDIQELFRLSKLRADGSFVNDVNNVAIRGNQGEVQGLFNHLITPMVGASGAISGLLVAFAMLYPDAKIMLLIPPIPIKAKYLVPALIVIEIYLGASNNPGDNVAHFAHIGGAIIAFFVIRYWKKNQYRLR